MVDVAVKTLQAYEDSKDMANFENEMAISADPLINHPNIVKVYGLVEGGKTLLYTFASCCLLVSNTCIADQIVMEYLPYGDLKSFLSVSLLLYRDRARLQKLTLPRHLSYCRKIPNFSLGLSNICLI